MRISFGIECKDWRFYIARRKAQEKGEGNHRRSYNMLFTYNEELRKRNVETLVKMQLDIPKLNVNPTFKICFSSMKEGFVKGCRPFIRLDRYHLKGPYGGVFFSIIALYANTRLFPIAWAIT
jgi:hypothetical protein